MKRLILAGVVAALPLAGCADMTSTQQRALSGTALGAGGGAIIGAIAGNAGLAPPDSRQIRRNRRLISFRGGVCCRLSPAGGSGLTLGADGMLVRLGA
jgi:hypothetical protein